MEGPVEISWGLLNVIALNNIPENNAKWVSASFNGNGFGMVMVLNVITLNNIPEDNAKWVSASFNADGFLVAERTQSRLRCYLQRQL